MHIRILQRATAACLVLFAPTSLLAAGGPYIVDDAAIGKPGECQIESWASYASNGRFLGTTQPACVFNFGSAVEMTASLAATRSDTWSKFTGLQAKLVPWEASGIAIAFSAGTVLDVTNGESTFSYVNVPITIKVQERVRINLNAGVLWDDRDHFTWGAGFEWDFRQSWTLIGEVFGVTGASEDPRLQLGVRHTPTKSVDLDLVYGNNITNEHAHWLTAGLTVRF